VICIIGVDCIWLHFISKLFHLFVIEVQLLSCIHVNGLIWIYLNPLTSHFVSLGIPEMIFGECLGQYKPFVGGSHVYSCWGLYFYLLWMEKLITSKHPNFRVFEQFDGFACFTRFKSCLSSRLFCARNIFIGQRLTKLPLNL